jgi:MSHA biogenesis protein MshP
MYLKRSYNLTKPANKQNGSMIVMALFVLIVVGLLAAALINIVSVSSNTMVYQVYGLRAQQAAKAGIEELLFTSFPANGSALSCNATVLSPTSFSNVRGLNECSYTAQCVTEAIAFDGINRLHFRFTSTGSCQIDNSVVSRTLSVDALQVAP